MDLCSFNISLFRSEPLALSGPSTVLLIWCNSLRAKCSCGPLVPLRGWLRIFRAFTSGRIWVYYILRVLRGTGAGEREESLETGFQAKALGCDLRSTGDLASTWAMPSSHGPDADFDEILFVREHTTPRRCSETMRQVGFLTNNQLRTSGEGFTSTFILSSPLPKWWSHWFSQWPIASYIDNFGPIILDTLPSRRIPLSFEGDYCPLYTDAFFQLGDRQLKPNEENVPRSWPPSSSKNIQKGWGFAACIGKVTLASHGVIPPSVLQPYSKRRAFIYVLELMAPIIAIISVHRSMSPFALLWIDNKAGLAALSRGYGRDVAVNNMLSFFWCFLARAGIFLHCEWVPSAHNLADGISRHSLDEAQYGHWTLLEVPLKPLHSIFNDVHMTLVSPLLKQWLWHGPGLSPSGFLISCWAGRQSSRWVLITLTDWTAHLDLVALNAPTTWMEKQEERMRQSLHLSTRSPIESWKWSWMLCLHWIV